MAVTPRTSQKRRLPPTHVLVLAPDGATLVDRKGRVQVLTPDATARTRYRGRVLTVDLSAVSDTTFVSLPGLAPNEVSSAIHLTPGEYLPNAVHGDTRLSVLPTVDDQGTTSALIAFAPADELAGLHARLTRLGLTPVGVEPAVVTATHHADTQGTVVLHVQPHQDVSLLMRGGQVIARTRDAASGTVEQRIGRLYPMISGLASLLSPTDYVQHVILLGEPDTVSALRASIQHNAPNVRVSILRGEDLARLALTHPPLTPIQALSRQEQAKVSQRPRWWPLAPGLALGTLPGLVLGVQNAGIRNTMQTQQVLLSQHAAPLQEHASLLAREAEAQRVVQEAEAILGSRVNWRDHLTRVTDQLPEKDGRYAVRFLTLLASARRSEPPPAASEPTGSEPAPAVPARPTKPNVTYTFAALAESRAAATTAIANLERVYRLNLEALDRDPGGGWRLRGSMQERPTPEVP
ncbi:hypothetical protein [Deinococcus sp. YIM 77859]|uniref:hypothetical protein n=1 Tax=Deinococcus sp. YIM 77859 TaxID=1540221 RepID=UPI0005571F3D|nr:hypothetical protein [Deinococcus sp. YIM 77859]